MELYLHPLVCLNAMGELFYFFFTYGVFILHSPRKFHRLKVSFLLETVTCFVVTGCRVPSSRKDDFRTVIVRVSVCCKVPNLFPPSPFPVNSPAITLNISTSMNTGLLRGTATCDVCRQVLAIFILCNKAGG